MASISTITVNIGLNITDDTLDQILYLLGIWQDHNPDKYIVGERVEEADGYRTTFKVKHFEEPWKGEQNDNLHDDNTRQIRTSSCCR